MDLSAVAKKQARGGRGRGATPEVSVANSGTGGDSPDTSDSEDDDAPGLDSESAKQLLRAYVKNSLDGVRNGQRAQYYE
jgi:hypothetical protein